MIATLLLPACAGLGSGAPGQNPLPQMGQYQRPAYQMPAPTRRMPDDDLCRARLFMGLVGQHEGGIVFATLPGRTRVIKPAETELDQDDFLEDMRPDPPFIEIREYLSGQILYAPAIRAVSQVNALGPIERDRLTIELDRYGYVSQIGCN